MLSDDELLNHDASDNLFIRDTPREDSPRTLTRHLINRFGLSSKGGTETVTNNTHAASSWPRDSLPLVLIASYSICAKLLL